MLRATNRRYPRSVRDASFLGEAEKRSTLKFMSWNFWEAARRARASLLLRTVLHYVGKLNHIPLTLPCSDHREDFFVCRDYRFQ